MSEMDAYCAGLMDGEGSIVARRPKHGRGVSVFVSMENTTYELVRILHRQYGGYVYSRPGRKPGWRPQEQWKAVGVDAERALVRMLPFLVRLRPRAEAGVRIIRLRGDSGYHLTSEKAAEIQQAFQEFLLL